MYYIVGLGNPGKEYEKSRHNTGRMVVDGLELGTKAKIITSDSYMNTSGAALKKVITSAKKAEKLIVVHDDIDMPLGKLKIVFGRGSGGHKGVESVNRAVKTKNYIRVRIGISPTTPGGKLKKPLGPKGAPLGRDSAVVDFVIKPFKPAELATLKSAIKKAREAIDTIVVDGLPKAMNEFN